MSTISNIARNMVRPGYATVMAGKLVRRIEPNTRAAALEWSRAHATTTELLCATADRPLWDEAKEWFARFRISAQERLAGLDVNLGGGGDAELLYFLTRRLQPEHAVETGVAAGWSSAAILAAMDANGTGTLHSSDFPYFRHAAPEQHVGLLVPTEHRYRWQLHLRGDRRNLPRIFREAGSVGLFHYDSDKSVGGRRLALRLASPHLTSDAVIVMDDIDNNTFFRDLTTRTGRPWSVVRGDVGIIGFESRMQ